MGATQFHRICKGQRNHVCKDMGNAIYYERGCMTHPRPRGKVGRHMSEIERLYELQELDLRIVNLENEIARLEAKLSDDSILAEASKRLRALEAHADQFAARRRTVDRTLEGLQDRLERIQARLYSGAITNVKEMEAAEAERAVTERSIAENEDELLEIMVTAEEIDESLAKGRQIVGKLENQRQADISSLTAKVDDARGKLLTLSPQRSEMTAAISPPTLHRYETLRSSKGGMAIARVERGLCSGCRMALTTSELQRVRSATDPMSCGSCRRLLYLP